MSLAASGRHRMPTQHPSQKFFVLKEAARFLEMDVRQFKRYVDAGLFPQGTPSTLRGSVMVWSRQDLRYMHWAFANQERFNLRPEKDEKPPKS